MYDSSARAGESKWWSWHIRSSAVAMWPCARRAWRQGTLPSLRSMSSDWQDQPPTVPHKSWNTKHSVARCDWHAPLSMGFTSSWSQSWGWLPFLLFIAWTFWGGSSGGVRLKCLSDILAAKNEIEINIKQEKCKLGACYSPNMVRNGDRRWF